MTGADQLLRAILDGITPPGVLADWYREQGQERLADWWQHGAPPPPDIVFYGDGDGYGSGSGDGSGDGSGYGYGDGDGNGDGSGDGYGYGDGDGYGSGDGDGYGYGDGNGYGYGDGNGYGYGDGDGYGYGKAIPGGAEMPVVGLSQLIVCGYGWVICGFVEEQIGPFQFRVKNASIICRTNGVPWDMLADGFRRNEPTYRRWGTVTVGPNFGPCREWVGELP